jgi:hypothetical protein
MMRLRRHAVKVRSVFRLPDCLPDLVDLSE